MELKKLYYYNLKDSTDLPDQYALINFKDDPGDDVIRITFIKNNGLDPNCIHILLQNPIPPPVNGGSGEWNIPRNDFNEVVIDRNHYYSTSLKLKIDYMRRTTDNYILAGQVYGMISDEIENLFIMFKFDNRVEDEEILL